MKCTRYFFHAAIVMLLNAPSFAASIDALGLSEYRNLAEDNYDFSVIERSEQLIATLNHKPSRPSHCPLTQSNGKDLLDKLMQLENALQSGACKEYKEGFLSSFSTSVAKLNQVQTGMPIQKSDEPASSTNQQNHFRNVSDMVGSLSGLVSDTRCALDIKERGLIPVVSDILGSASVAALYVPSNLSYLVGLSGLAVTASLKIVSSLLLPNYNMAVAKDRDNFIKLACTFYDLRNEMERNNFLRIPSKQDVRNHLMVKSYMDTISSKLEWLEASQTHSNTTLAEHKNNFVTNDIGAAKFNFYQELPELKKVIASTEENTTRSLQYRLRLKLALEKIARALPGMNFDADHYRLFSNVDDDVAVLANYRDLLFTKDAHKITDHDLALVFGGALGNIEAILAEEMRASVLAFDQQNVDSRINFGELLNHMQLTFANNTNKLAVTLSQLQEKDTELTKITARKNFQGDDEGTHIDHTVITEIKAIQSSIYGHYGWHFFKYVRDSALDELNDFYHHYHEFRMSYLPRSLDDKEIKIHGEHERRLACATASNILLSINNSRSLVNMAADFIFTNRDFFHNNVGEIDFHLKVIPTGVSVERRLLVEAESLINAKKHIARTNLVGYPDEVLHANFFERPFLGELMLAQTYADQRIVRLYRFQEQNGCMR